MKRKSANQTNLPMEKAKLRSTENIEHEPLRIFTEKAYLDYSMYVILDRALPHIGDGLKPVQRRIIYAMSELGLTTLAKYKKSARTVGDVLGKFHPHGESACYEAMVLMAQPFSYHYPLIDGQGNWGSQDDPKSFAAMRYTESRLTPYAQVLLAELTDGTVDWLPNFDATLQEPRLLPARLPNILLNGATGIAVGMATDIPPHNLIEVVNACVYLLDHPKASLTDLCQYIKGPDFPSSAEITTPYTEIYAAYQQGYGSIQARAVYTKEKEQIVITALPYQVSGTKIMTQIAEQIREKKLSLIEDLRDESDHENPTRLIIVPRSNRVDTDALMAHLFATTDLERSYRINLNMIGLDGRPGTKNLVMILQEWLDYRQETVRKRLIFRLNKVETRLHLLKGFLTVYNHLNEIIKIIREQDNPKQYLISHFQLTEIQADAILEMRLRQLAKLEENKLLAEEKNLIEERDKIKKILDSKAKLKNLVRSELQEDAKRHGNKRMSPLIQRDPAKILQKTEVIASEPMTVILSTRGWVRAAKGHDFDASSLTFKTGDSLKASVPGRSNQPVVFIDSTGRSYSTPIHTLPSARSSGEPLTSRFNPPADAHFQAVVTGDPEQSILVSSDAGYGFITQLAALYSKNRNGKNLITLPKHAHVLAPRLIDDLKASSIAIATNKGYLLIIAAQEIPIQLKGKGNKIIQIPGNKDKNQKEFVVDIRVLSPDVKKLILIAGKKRSALPLSSLTQYRGKRGQRGRRLTGFQKLDHLSIELGN